jgi:hypothetical protein
MVGGIYDEAQTLYGNPDVAFKQLADLRTKSLRVNLYWGGRFAASRRKPLRYLDPDEPGAYDWGIYDRLVLYAAQYDIKVVFSIVGTPGWANRNKGWRVAPTNYDDLRKFAFTAAMRYSGTKVNNDGRLLPKVPYFLAWNEPNNPSFLQPQYRGKTIVSGATYAKICNAVVRGVRQASTAAAISRQLVACGVTAPRGNNNPRGNRPSVAPLPFIRAMKRGGATGFDAYAHHPYHERPSESPTKKPKGTGAMTLANINTLIAEYTKAFGRKPLWITEYGWETQPQDRRFGVSYAKQSLYLKQSFAIARKHPRIGMMLWFLFKDDTNKSIGWQSGLMTSTGRKKPSWNAFRALNLNPGLAPSVGRGRR